MFTETETEKKTNLPSAAATLSLWRRHNGKIGTHKVCSSEEALQKQFFCIEIREKNKFGE